DGARRQGKGELRPGLIRGACRQRDRCGQDRADTPPARALTHPTLRDALRWPSPPTLRTPRRIAPRPCVMQKDALRVVAQGIRVTILPPRCRAATAWTCRQSGPATDLGLARDRQLNACKSGKPDLHGPSAAMRDRGRLSGRIARN